MVLTLVHDFICDVHRTTKTNLKHHNATLMVTFLGGLLESLENAQNW